MISKIFTAISSAHFKFRLGVCLISFIAMLALCAPWLAPVDSFTSPFSLDLTATNLPPGSVNHFLGTDNLGRDLLGQLIWGARASLLVGLCSALCAVTFGSLWGATSAFAGSFLESIMMRLVDVLLSIPNFVLLLVVSALVTDLPWTQMLPSWLCEPLGINHYSNGILPLLIVILVISTTTWLEVSRICAAAIKGIMSEEYVDAAKCMGLTFWQIIFKHLLTNAQNILLLEGTLLVADAILMESGLSFLGLGLGPCTPSWGSMLNSAQKSLLIGNWWSVVAPGLLITTTVLSVQLIASDRQGYRWNSP